MRFYQLILLMVVIQIIQIISLSVGDSYPGHYGNEEIKYNGLVVLPDESLKDSCGPIACYFSLRLNGVSIKLQKVMDDLGWAPGSPTKIDNIENYMKSNFGLVCNLTNIDVENLSYFLKGGDKTALAVIISKETNNLHIVNLLDFSEEGFSVVDYPNINYKVKKQQFGEIYAGTSILISSRTNFIYGFFNISFCLILFFIFISISISTLRRILASYGCRTIADQGNCQG